MSVDSIQAFNTTTSTQIEPTVDCKAFKPTNFTNAIRKNCPKCIFFLSGIFCRGNSIKKSKYCCHPPFHPPIFRRHSLQLFSPTLPILMNWILLSPPPLSSYPDNSPKFGTST